MSLLSLKIRAFGICQDIVGGKTLEVSLEKPHDTDHLMSHIENQYPRIRALKSIALAVNEEYIQDNCAVAVNDRIALIPPVAGG